MTGIEAAAYMLIFFSGVSFLYATLVAVEMRIGSRVAPRFRSHLDRKTKVLLTGAAAYGNKTLFIYKQAHKAFISGFSRVMHPVTDVRKRMHMIRVGKTDITDRSPKKVSAHLRTLRTKR